MKERKLYMCEVCGVEYADKNEAIKCETGHKRGLKIVKSYYKGINCVSSGFPTKIWVCSENGSENKEYHLA